MFFSSECFIFYLLGLVVLDMSGTEMIDAEGHFNSDWAVAGEFKSPLNYARTEHVFSGSQLWTEVTK